MGLAAGLASNCLLTVGWFGDSNFHGTGANTGLPTKQSGSRWPLWNLLQQNGINTFWVGDSNNLHDADVVQVYHDGIDGTTISSNQATLAGRMAINAPEVVVYCMGTNDCIGGQAAATSLLQIQTNVAALWDIGQRPGVNKTRLIIVCSPPATPSNNSLAQGMSQGLPAVVSAINNGGQRNCKFVDLWTILGTNTVGNAGANFNPASSPHPNDAGYVLIAQSVLGAKGSGLLIDYTR
jgi:lysophospholipase L1-like esterase